MCLFKPSTGGCFSFVIYPSSGSQTWRKHLLPGTVLLWNCNINSESCQLRCFLDLSVLCLLNTFESKEMKTRCSCSGSGELIPDGFVKMAVAWIHIKQILSSLPNMSGLHCEMYTGPSLLKPALLWGFLAELILLCAFAVYTQLLSEQRCDNELVSHTGDHSV